MPFDSIAAPRMTNAPPMLKPMPNSSFVNVSSVASARPIPMVRAFAELVDRYKDLVYGVIYRMVPDGGLADDLSQEVFLKIHRGPPYFRGEARLSADGGDLRCRARAAGVGRRDVVVG
jgi:hypothetical protein